MKVCIDPGHGMSNRQKGVYDPGAVHTENGFAYQEAAIALRYALALKDVLRARQIPVIMTRDDPQDHTPLGRRAAIAKEAGCDVLISFHLNAAEADQANGLEVLYKDANDKALANRLQPALIAATKLRDRGIKHRPELAVLKFSKPAVLIELGFIGNDKDRETLLDSLVRAKVCTAIADTLLNAAAPHGPGT